MAPAGRTPVAGSIWRLRDELWEVFVELLPERAPLRTGRPRVDDQRGRQDEHRPGVAARCASLRYERSTRPRVSIGSRIACSSEASSRWTASLTGRPSSRLPASRRRARQRCARTSWRSRTQQCACAPTRRRPRRRSVPAARAWSARSRARGPGRKARALPCPGATSNSTASSFNAAPENRSFSARKFSSSTASADADRLGFAEANAANAASFATRSEPNDHADVDPYFRPASAWEISCEVTSKKISHT